MASLRSGSGNSFGRLVLPPHLRHRLGEITGQIVPEDALRNALRDSRVIVTIGDVVTLTLLEAGMVPDISVVDFKTKRIPQRELEARLAKFKQPTVKVRNPPGEITPELWGAVRDGYANLRKLRIVVDGEEDLAALPCIALSPEGTTVIYGIPNRGLMVLHVDRKARHDVEDILKQMET